MSHTPGPWTVPHFAKEDSGCHCGYVFDNEGEYTVCEVFFQDESDEYGQNPPIDQAKANARLIAAAPELFEAIDAILPLATAFVGEYGATHGFPNGHPTHKAAIEAATEALRKADRYKRC